MLPAVWIPDAEQDAADARAWYDSINPDLGMRFASALDASVNLMCRQPLGYQIVHFGYPARRSEAFSVWPFLQGGAHSDRCHRMHARST